MSFSKNLRAELGRNTGKWISNKVFGDTGWATPRRHVINVEQRRKEREEAKAYKEQLSYLNKQLKEEQKEAKEFQRRIERERKEDLVKSNENEVHMHNSYLHVIQTVHKDYSEKINWNELVNMNPPLEVKSTNEMKGYYSEKANKETQKKIDTLKKDFNLSFVSLILGKYYKPNYSWIFEVFGGKIFLYFTIVCFYFSMYYYFTSSSYLSYLLIAISIIIFLFSLLLFFGSKDFVKIVNLDNEIIKIRKNQHYIYDTFISKHERKFNEYLEAKKEYEKLINIAKGVLNSNELSYYYAINYYQPFEDLELYGANISYEINNNLVEVDFHVHDEDVVPRTTKRSIRNGLEIREDIIPNSRLNEIYQDYVCSCILRIAKEIFQLLPVNKVQINAINICINSSTGNYEEGIIVSVLIDRQRLDELNFELLDPSESMKNFACNMSFNKSKGFSLVEKISS